MFGCHAVHARRSPQFQDQFKSRVMDGRRFQLFFFKSLLWRTSRTTQRKTTVEEHEDGSKKVSSGWVEVVVVQWVGEDPGQRKDSDYPCVHPRTNAVKKALALLKDGEK